MRVGGCNAVDGPSDKQEVELFFVGALTVVCSLGGCGCPKEHLIRLPNIEVRYPNVSVILRS